MQLIPTVLDPNFTESNISDADDFYVWTNVACIDVFLFNVYFNIFAGVLHERFQVLPQQKIRQRSVRWSE